MTRSACPIGSTTTGVRRPPQTTVSLHPTSPIRALPDDIPRSSALPQVPWGMAVNRNGSERLGRALDLMSQIFHRDGVFLASARANRIGTAFLEQQATVWARSECNSDTGT